MFDKILILVCAFVWMFVFSITTSNIHKIRFPSIQLIHLFFSKDCFNHTFEAGNRIVKYELIVPFMVLKWYYIDGEDTYYIELGVELI